MSERFFPPVSSFAGDFFYSLGLSRFSSLGHESESSIIFCSYKWERGEKLRGLKTGFSAEVRGSQDVSRRLLTLKVNISPFAFRHR